MRKVNPDLSQTPTSQRLTEKHLYAKAKKTDTGHNYVRRMRTDALGKSIEVERDGSLGFFFFSNQVPLLIHCFIIVY